MQSLIKNHKNNSNSRNKCTDLKSTISNFMEELMDVFMIEVSRCPRLMLTTFVWVLTSIESCIDQPIFRPIRHLSKQ